MTVIRARIRTFFEYKELFYLLVSRDIKLKYRRSYLGYIWSILNPLLLMLVLIAVFSKMFHRSIPNFPAYLISGQVLFNFMSESTRDALSSIVNNASLLKKTYVPKYIFTLSRVTSAFVSMLFSFGALLLVYLFTGVSIKLMWILFFVPILQLYVFSIGLGLFLAQATVFFQDIKYIYSVFITAWMYFTPIFYSIDILPDWLTPLVKWCNPMYSYITQFRSIMLDGEIGSVKLLAIGVFFAFFMLVLGLWTFTRTKDKFILYI